MTSRASAGILDAIAAGAGSEDAAAAIGLSPAVGVRWFREGGGMRTVNSLPLSGRYLSFAEREEIGHPQRAGGEVSVGSLVA